MDRRGYIKLHWGPQNYLRLELIIVISYLLTIYWGLKIKVKLGVKEAFSGFSKKRNKRKRTFSGLSGFGR